MPGISQRSMCLVLPYQMVKVQMFLTPSYIGHGQFSCETTVLPPEGFTYNDSEYLCSAQKFQTTYLGIEVIITMVASMCVIVYVLACMCMCVCVCTCTCIVDVVRDINKVHVVET